MSQIHACDISDITPSDLRRALAKLRRSTEFAVLTRAESHAILSHLESLALDVAMLGKPRHVFVATVTPDYKP